MTALAQTVAETIHAIKETEAPMPPAYRQGWQDACDKVAAALHHGAGGLDRLVRDVASQPEAKVAQTVAELVAWLRESANHWCDDTALNREMAAMERAAADALEAQAARIAELEKSIGAAMIMGKEEAWHELRAALIGKDKG
jgi:hypothetical protein